jgi:hypothetical protein
VPENKPVEAAVVPQPVASEPSNSPSPAQDTQSAEDAALAAKRQREKDQREKERKAREEKANAASETAEARPAATAAAAGPKKVTVQVTYDESGRVVQASGGDPTAVRIARQKHFPPGKAGTATITISMN